MRTSYRKGIPSGSSCLTLNLSDRNRCSGCTRFQSTIHAAGTTKVRIQKERCANQWKINEQDEERDCFLQLRPSKKLMYMSTWDELDRLGYSLPGQYLREKAAQSVPSLSPFKATPFKQLKQKRNELLSTLRKTIKRLRRTEVSSPQNNIFYSLEDASFEIRRIDLLPELQKEKENEDEFLYDGLISNVQSPTKKDTPSPKCDSPTEYNISSQKIDSSCISIPIEEYDRLQ